MTGRPIPGEHWVRLEWPRMVQSLESVVIDYEVAKCDDYRLVLKSTISGEEITLFEARTKVHEVRTVGKQHILHTIAVSYERKEEDPAYDALELLLLRPGTQWGVSIWELQVTGQLSTQ